MADISSAQSPLFMIQLWLDLRRLVELGRALHLPVQRVDDNYITHCALRELFGDHTPGPFSVENNSGRYLRVLSYGSLPFDDLQATAQAFAGPMVYQIPDWSRVISKPMPQTFSQGTRLGFELRVCPVIRKSSTGKHHGVGAEVDAFLARVGEVDDPKTAIDREDVYRDWLTDQFKRSGAALPHAIQLKRFSLERMCRRNHEKRRKVTTIKRPAATMTGDLEVTNSTEFIELLRRGIGRHRAFGFGMLKIKRPGG
ncbi:TPA: type I-E CRISPR-associated protein Cas6/Cse3/CasE [Candidatus Acetothermia bacterium]|nr:type I-E CRISPR-associated protein Cas6/Cse3/CasE [Candidatus Acetothermia bacterium]